MPPSLRGAVVGSAGGADKILRPSPNPIGPANLAFRRDSQKYPPMYETSPPQQLPRRECGRTSYWCLRRDERPAHGSSPVLTSTAKRIWTRHDGISRLPGTRQSHLTQPLWMATDLLRLTTPSWPTLEDRPGTVAEHAGLIGSTAAMAARLLSSPGSALPRHHRDAYSHRASDCSVIFPATWIFVAAFFDSIVQ